MLVAQWDRVHPHPHGSDNHEGIDEEYLNRVGIAIASNSIMHAVRPC